MKKIYEMPEVELMQFAIADILSTSEVPDVPEIPGEGTGEWDDYYD